MKVSNAYMIFDVAMVFIDIGMYESQPILRVQRDNPPFAKPLLLRPAKQKLITSRRHGINDTCVAKRGGLWVLLRVGRSKTYPCLCNNINFLGTNISPTSQHF